MGGGSTLAPGDSPGTLTVTADTTFAAGGNYNWQVLDAAPGGGGLSERLGSPRPRRKLAISATSAAPFAINLWSLSATSPDVSGPAANFDPAQSAAWTLVTAPDGITGFASDAFVVETAAANGTDGFANDLAGGSFSVVQSGNSLNLVFSPVPEPSVLVLGLAAGLAVAPLVVRSRFRIAPEASPVNGTSASVVGR